MKMTSTYNICGVSAKQQFVGDKFFDYNQKYCEFIVEIYKNIEINLLDFSYILQYFSINWEKYCEGFIDFDKNIAIFLSKLEKISQIFCFCDSEKINNRYIVNKDLNMSHNGVKYIQGLLVKTIR